MRLLSFAVVVAIAASGCSNKPVVSPSPVSFFPLQENPNPDTMSALLVGKLVLVNGCLRVNNDEGTSYLPIWPRSFAWRTSGNTIEVIDGNGRLAARLGDHVRVGGGEMPAQYISKYVLQPLPESCSGPYWIVGNEITR